MTQHLSRKPGSQRYYGWQPSKPDQRDYRFSVALEVLDAMPAAFDLTLPELPAPWVPCWDQGREGACGAFTAAECIVLDGERDENILLMPIPSAQFIYYNARVVMGTVNQDSGVNNRDLLKSLVRFGWCDNDLDPYTDNQSQLAVRPSQDAYDQGATRRIKEYQSVQQNLDQMKACIFGGHPIICGFSVYESFESAAVASTGIVPMPSQMESVIGGHDVSVLGFNSGAEVFNGIPPQHFKFRNHWYVAGKPWGSNGYGFMQYEYLTNPRLAGDFWCISKSGLPVPTPSPPQPIPNPPGGNHMTQDQLNAAIDRIIGIAAFVAKWTPTPIDDKVVAFVTTAWSNPLVKDVVWKLYQFLTANPNATEAEIIAHAHGLLAAVKQP